MKLNNTQIKALAQEVLNKIPEVKTKFTKEQLSKYTKVINEYKKLDLQRDILDKKMKTIMNDINKSKDFNSHIYTSYIKDIKTFEKYLKPTIVRPTLEELVHKITLETVFETKESLNEFVDNLVKEYSK